MLLTGDPKELSDATTQVIDQMNSGRFAESDIFSVHLALEEALANAWKHGNVGDRTKKIRLKYQIDDDQVWIQVEDEGVGFSLDDVPDPTLPENVERPSGRGVMLIRSFMDGVQYNEQGNCVTMWKNRQGASD